MGLRKNKIDKNTFIRLKKKDKFNFLQKLFNQQKVLSFDDFSLLLKDEKNIASFFLEEYHYKDKDELKKYRLIESFINKSLNLFEEYEYGDIVNIAHKIEYFDWMFRLTYSKMTNLEQTITIGFIEDNFDKIDKELLKYSLTNLNSVCNSNLNRFLVLFNFSRIDKSYYKDMKYYLKLNDPIISERIINNKVYYKKLI